MFYTTAEQHLLEPSVRLGTSVPACHRPPVAESRLYANPVRPGGSKIESSFCNSGQSVVLSGSG